jgi:hypothetical protein
MGRKSGDGCTTGWKCMILGVKTLDIIFNEDSRWWISQFLDNEPVIYVCEDSPINNTSPPMAGLYMCYLLDQVGAVLI